MEFRILGPLEVIDGGQPVPIREGRDRALLALLLLQPNEVLSSDRLIDELWHERPPPTAAKILQNAIARLRRAVGDSRIETRAHGYRFRLEPGELDADRFEQLALTGRDSRDPAILPKRSRSGAGRRSATSPTNASPPARRGASRTRDWASSRTGSRATSSRGSIRSSYRSSSGSSAKSRCESARTRS